MSTKIVRVHIRNSVGKIRANVSEILVKFVGDFNHILFNFIVNEKVEWWWCRFFRVIENHSYILPHFLASSFTDSNRFTWYIFFARRIDCFKILLMCRSLSSRSWRKGEGEFGFASFNRRWNLSLFCIDRINPCVIQVDFLCRYLLKRTVRAGKKTSITLFFI